MPDRSGRPIQTETLPGCGTAYVSAWLARLGARPVGIDNSPNQLATARMLQAEHGLDFPLLLGNAERVPYSDASFDVAISEYGACLWADPYAWVPEAGRLLRPGGRLVFLTNHPIFMLVTGARESGFEIERPVEIQAPARPTYGGGGGLPDEEVPLGLATREWARTWPTEESWIARKRG